MEYIHFTMKEHGNYLKVKRGITDISLYGISMGTILWRLRQNMQR